MARNTIKEDEKTSRRSKKDLVIRLFRYLNDYKKESLRFCKGSFLLLFFNK